MKASLFSLLAVANAAVVTQTQFATHYVTVDGYGNLIRGSPRSGSSSSGSSSSGSSSSSSDVANINNYAWTFNYGFATAAAAAAAEPESTSTSTSKKARFPKTSSTSSYVAPETSSTTESPTAEPSTAEPTSSTPTSSSTSQTGEASAATGLQADILNYHNRVRAAHHVDPLTWDDTLATYAQNYLAKSNCVFAHSGGQYGENIAIGYTTTDAAQDAWYFEKKLYNYAAGQFSSATGHFTQMVWKGTSRVGCATIDCSGGTYLACEYADRGNIVGKFTANVFAE